MKRILFPSVTLAVLSSLAACVNRDEKLVTGVSSQYYSTPDGLNSAVISGYAQLRGFYGKEQLLSMTQVGTDTWQSGDQSGSNNINFDAYNTLKAAVFPMTLPFDLYWEEARAYLDKAGFARH